MSAPVRQSVMRELSAFQQEVGHWADATFPRSSAESITNHLLAEAKELRDVAHAYPDGSPARPGRMEEEAADCLLLLLHLACKMRFDLLTSARDKMRVNQGRVWEDEDNGRGYWKHIEPVVEGCVHEIQEVSVMGVTCDVGSMMGCEDFERLLAEAVEAALALDDADARYSVALEAIEHVPTTPHPFLQLGAAIDAARRARATAQEGKSAPQLTHR